jgi:hypothetical protein
LLREYIEYKMAKVGWTMRAIDMAKVVATMKEKGMKTELKAIKKQLSRGQALA